MPDNTDNDELMWQLVNEFTKRLELGEKPSIEEYCERHPDLAEEIRDLFPTVFAVEDMAASGVSSRVIMSGPPPKSVGDYRIIREIGRGGMGVVYEAEHEELGRRVAVKILPGKLTGDAKTLARFRREGRAVAKLHHTNIVPLFAVGEDGGMAYIAMQLIHGQSLDHVIKDMASGSVNSKSAALLPAAFMKSRSHTSNDSGSVVSVSDSSVASSHSYGHRFYSAIAEIGRQSAEALDYAHERKVVHRDVKPSNLILDESGVVWLTDFGLAKMDDEELTATGEFLGTLRYMAPERFSGKCDARSDVYGLGLTIYELLTRKPAYGTTDRVQMIDAITNTDPPSPRSTNPRIPRDLETIVLTAIDKEPRSRYKSAQLMADDLGRFLRDEPILARRISPLERAARWVRRNRRLAAALCAAAALLVFWAVRERSLRSLADAQRTEANTARAVAEERGKQLEAQGLELEKKGLELQRGLYYAEMNLAGQSARDPFGASTIHTRLQAWHPDRVGVDLRGWEWYYLHALSHRERFVSKQLGQWVWSVDVDPTGKTVANAINSWGVQVRDLDTGEVLREKQFGAPRFVRYSPDGKHIAVSGFNDTVSILDAATLDVVSEFGGGRPREVWRVDWRPDGKQIATCARARDEIPHCFEIWDVFTGELIKKVGTPHQVNGVLWSPDGKTLVSFEHTRSIIWDTGTWESIAEKKEAGTGCFSPDGEHIVVSDFVFDAKTGEQIATLSGGAGIHMSWRPSASEIAVAHRDGSIKIVDAKTGKLTRTLVGHTNQLRDLSWSPQGDRLVSCGLDQTVRTWDLNDGDLNQVIPEIAAEVSAWSHDGVRIALGSHWARKFSIWDSASGEMVFEDQDANEVCAVCWSPVDRKVAYSGMRWLRIYDLESDKITHYDVCQERMQRLDWSADGSLLAGAEWEHAHLFVLGAEKQEVLIARNNAGAKCVAWHPQKSWLAVGYADGRVQLLDKTGDTHKTIWEAKHSDHLIADVRFSRDGTRLAAATNGAIPIWDTQTGEPLHVLDDLSDDFYRVAWSHDDSQLATCSGSSINIWDIKSGKVAIKLASGGYVGVDWSPDGKKLVAGSYDRGYQIWDATAGYKEAKQAPNASE